jgi:hypothetical protein
MFTLRLTNTASSLIAGKPTSRELMHSIPANNPPDYFKMLRRDYGITVLKEKVKNKSHYRFWIPKCEHSRVRKLIACAGTQTIDKSGSISKTTNSNGSITQPNELGGVE